MPHKHNADRRHHIPKMSFKVRNWPAYEAGLRRRGSLTLWIEDAALECWQTIGPGGQARYANAAIQTSLMLRAAFKLALPQIEGLMTSVLSLMGLTISAPDHPTVSRRAVTLRVIQAPSVPRGPLHVLIDSTGLQVYGAGQWLEAKHGAKSRRTWRKLHLAVDAANGMIVAQTLTDQDADDPSQVGPLLDQIAPLERVDCALVLCQLQRGRRSHRFRTFYRQRHAHNAWRGRRRIGPCAGARADRSRRGESGETRARAGTLRADGAGCVSLLSQPPSNDAETARLHRSREGPLGCYQQQQQQQQATTRDENALTWQAQTGMD
jgi:Transposase DDE domain